MGNRESSEMTAPRSRLFGEAAGANKTIPGRGEPRRGAGAVPDTILGTGLHFQGEVQGEGNLEIHGHFEGNVNLQGRLHVRPDGTFLGEVKATEVIIEGQLRGDVDALQRADLRPNSRVEAQIRTDRFTIGEGCHFEGQVKMPERAGAGDANRPKAKVAQASS